MVSCTIRRLKHRGDTTTNSPTSGSSTNKFPRRGSPRVVTDHATPASNRHVWKGILASTRPVRLRDEDRVVSFAPEALEGMAAQITQGYIPLNYEHLTFLPPIGRIDNATIHVAYDGESELLIAGRSMPNHRIVDRLDLPSTLDDLPEVSSPELSIRLNYTPRNFDQEIAREILEECGDIADPHERWAELPPLEFVLLIPVVWSAGKFFGSFLSALGKAAGDALAAKISSWARKSKHPSRTIIFALQFELPDGSNICGYVLSTSEQLRVSIDTVLEMSEELAVVAGLQNEMTIFPNLKEAAFFLADGKWHLGWWTDGERVFHTAWLDTNPPDIDGVLGRNESENT